jgi:TldD protein
MNGKLNDSLLYDLLKKMSRYGQYAEIFFEDSLKQAAVFENGKLDRIENSSDIGIAFRIIEGEATYFAYTNNLDDKSLLKAVDSLVAASEAGYTKDINMTDRVSVKYYQTPAQTSIEDKIKLVSEMDKAARFDSRIVQAASIYSESLRNTRVINSEGADICQSLNYVTGYTQAVASDGKDMQVGYIPAGGAFGAEKLKEIDFCNFAKESSKLAIKNLSANYAPAGKMPVVLSSSAGGTMVHEAVGHGLEADLACNGQSVYADKLGHKVASKLISVIDDGTIDNKRGSFIYDDEGTKAASNVLINNGVLENYMFDRLYSYKEGKNLTGNGRRQSYKHRPIVRMTNTIIKPGSSAPESIIKSVDSGIFVTRMGGGQVNTVTGDFVFEVTEGNLIKNGEIAEPIKNATLIGNGPKVMADIDMVGNDLGFGIGTCGKEGQGVPVSDAQPTLRIPEITVGGR